VTQRAKEKSRKRRVCGWRSSPYTMGATMRWVDAPARGLSPRGGVPRAIRSDFFLWFVCPEGTEEVTGKWT
jgi:hypothetical protein